MPEEMPGTTEQGVRPNDLVWSLINTVDNRLDDIAGVRILRTVGRILTAFAPANVVRSVTGVEKPSEVIEGAMDKIEASIKEKRAPEFPRLPGV